MKSLVVAQDVGEILCVARTMDAGRLEHVDRMKVVVVQETAEARLFEALGSIEENDA